MHKEKLEMLKLANPYHTTYGRFINTTKIKESLDKYVTLNKDINLSYEYFIDTDEELRIVFITGYNSDEQELPIWEHPLVFESMDKVIVVAVDVRKYVKPNSELSSKLSDIVKDASNLNFNIIRTLLTAEYAVGNTRVIKNGNKTMSMGMALWLSNIINTIVTLNPVEKLHVEIAIAFSINMMTISEDDRADSAHVAEARILSYRLSLPVSKTAMKVVVDKLNINVTDIDKLVDNIRSVLPAEKAKIIDTNGVVNLVNNSWFGPGGVETVMMALENLPTWIALLYIALSDKTFKRSKIATALDKISAKIKAKEFIRYVEIYIKENKVI